MKTHELYHTLEKASKKFEEALGFEDSEPLRESTIQRFEYTFELSWKLMSSMLKDQGVEEYGIKNILRASAKLGLIVNIDDWFEFAHARNLTSHLYKEEVADKVYKIATGTFFQEVQSLLQNSSSQTSI